MGKHKLRLTGRIGRIIYYESRGTLCSRAMPVKVRQTKATKDRAKEFGKAVRMSAQLRSGLVDVLHDAKARPGMYSLNYALQCWLNEYKPGEAKFSTELPFIDKLEFSDKCTLAGRLKRKIAVDWTNPGKIILSIPELLPFEHIRCPAGTEMVHWKVGAVSCSNSDLPVIQEQVVTGFEMEYNRKTVPARQITLDLPIGSGELVIVVVALKFSFMKRRLRIFRTESNWLPEGIVGSCYKE